MQEAIIYRSPLEACGSCPEIPDSCQGAKTAPDLAAAVDLHVAAAMDLLEAFDALISCLEDVQLAEKDLTP